MKLKKFVSENYVLVFGLISANIYSIYLNMSFLQWCLFVVFIYALSILFSKKYALTIYLALLIVSSIGLYSNGPKLHAYLVKFKDGHRICYQYSETISKDCLNGGKLGAYISHEYLGKDFSK